MTVWTWVLLGLGVAGALAAMAACLVLAAGVLRLRRRLRAMAYPEVTAALASLPLLSARLERSAAQAGALNRRAAVALATIRAASQQSGLPLIMAGLRRILFELHAIRLLLR